MARPHIEFIQSQWLPLDPGFPGGARPGAAAQVLSRDPDDGACSLLVHYPPGWSVDEQALDADEELFVLDGALELDGRVLGPHCYAHLPRGFLRRRLATPAGARVITFFSSEPTVREAAAFDQRRLVPGLDTRLMSGMTGPRKHMASEGFRHEGTVHKLLFDDPLTGDKTWIAGLVPYWNCDFIENHPVCEEEFALSGDVHLPAGIMREGAYFWRPANIPHGPFGTTGGTLHLCRGKGGKFSTRFERASKPFNWDPAYDPILPPSHAKWVPAGYDCRRSDILHAPRIGT
jgi:hypothetical protein